MFHLHVRRVSVGLRNSAKERFDYITRVGRYARRGDRVRTVINIQMPDWVRNPEQYWKQADSSQMRINGRLLFSIECALPRVLGIEDQTELARTFAVAASQMSAGDRSSFGVPVSFAIHEGVRGDDHSTGRLPNPHMHLLLSASVNDLLARTGTQWFRRFNAKYPERGGAPRSSFIGTKNWLLQIRSLWASLANAAFLRAGLPDRIDHRSHRARGISAMPTLHLGPKVARLESLDAISARCERNVRIQALNALLSLRDRQRVVAKAEAEKLEIELLAQERRLRRRLQNAEQEFVEIMNSHPFANASFNFMKDAHIFVTGLVTDIGGERKLDAQIDKRHQKILTQIGSLWMGLRIGTLDWYVAPKLDCTILVGPHFAAADSDSAQCQIAIVKIAREMNFRSIEVWIEKSKVEGMLDLFKSAGVVADFLTEVLADNRIEFPR